MATFLDSLGQTDDEDEDGAEFDDDSAEEGTATPSHTAELKAFQAYQQFLPELRAHSLSQQQSRQAGQLKFGIGWMIGFPQMNGSKRLGEMLPERAAAL